MEFHWPNVWRYFQTKWWALSLRRFRRLYLCVYFDAKQLLWIYLNSCFQSVFKNFPWSRLPKKYQSPEDICHNAPCSVFKFSAHSSSHQNTDKRRCDVPGSPYLIKKRVKCTVCFFLNFLSPPVQIARWAHMRHFLSVRLSSGLDQKS